MPPTLWAEKKVQAMSENELLVPLHKSAWFYQNLEIRKLLIIRGYFLELTGYFTNSYLVLSYNFPKFWGFFWCFTFLELTGYLLWTQWLISMSYQLWFTLQSFEIAFWSFP